MIGIESLLPKESSFDGLVGELRENIDLEIAAIRAGAVGDVINWTIVTPQALEQSSDLAAVLGYGDQAEKAALVRGALFTRQILWILYGPEAKYQLPEYFSDTGSLSTTRERVWLQGQQYMQRRPNIDRLVGYYMPEITGSQSAAYTHRVEEVCSLIFHSAERWRADQYIQQEFAEIDPTDFL